MSPDEESGHEPRPIRELSPVERGGVVARDGLAYQDHVAANFCIEMLIGDEISEVWCESQDDITLLYGHEPKRVEFVQVKSSVGPWTEAGIARRDGNRDGTSLLERSLQFDRCLEECSFRIVTPGGVRLALKPLTFPLQHAHRATLTNQLDELAEDLSDRLPGFESPNGNGPDFWAGHTYWDTRESSGSMESSGTLALMKHVEDRGHRITSEQAEELYRALCAKVQAAALADPFRNQDRKRIQRQTLVVWLEEEFGRITGRWTKPAKGLRDKLGAAGLEAEVGSAEELRRAYRRESSSPKYLSVGDRDAVEAEIVAELTNLRSRVDTGVLSDDGITIHAKSLEMAVNAADRISGSSSIPRQVLTGFVYELTDRCAHRFRRIGT